MPSPAATETTAVSKASPVALSSPAAASSAVSTPGTEMAPDYTQEACHYSCTYQSVMVCSEKRFKISEAFQSSAIMRKRLFEVFGMLV
eukprot:1437256-Amphidinium_carterae.1